MVTGRKWLPAATRVKKSEAVDRLFAVRGRENIEKSYDRQDICQLLFSDSNVSVLIRFFGAILGFYRATKWTSYGPNLWRYSPEVMKALTISALMKLPPN